MLFFFFQAEDGIRDLVRSRGLGDVYKRQALCRLNLPQFSAISLDSLNELTEWIQNIEDTEIQLSLIHI